jgi:ABC-type phosphate/phosphonate transport system ATPase subunit
MLSVEHLTKVYDDETRALMQEPELMLVDEPVSALDPATSHSILRYFEVLNDEDGVTILCSLHFLGLARTYAHRIVGLKGGKMVFDGLPAEIDEQRFREIYGADYGHRFRHLRRDRAICGRIGPHATLDRCAGQAVL